MEQFATILVILAFILVLLGAGCMTFYLGRLRVQLRKVDRNLFHSLGFDAGSMILLHPGPIEVQEFLLQGRYQDHFDVQVRRNAEMVLFSRKLYVASFILVLASFLLRVLAT